MNQRSRFCHLFTIKAFQLFWKIDSSNSDSKHVMCSHIAPTNQWVNVDGTVYHADYIIGVMLNNIFSARRLINGKRKTVRYESLQDLRNAA